MNNFSGLGRLTKDVQLTYTQNNIAVANSTIAINRPFTNANGEREADFIRIVAFRKTAELLNQYFQKGKQIAVRGRWQTRQYDDSNGNRQFVNELVVDEITFISDGSNQGTGQQNQSQGNNGYPNQNNASQGNYGRSNNSYQNVEQNPFQNQSNSTEISNDELPF